MKFLFLILVLFSDYVLAEDPKQAFDEQTKERLEYTLKEMESKMNSGVVSNALLQSQIALIKTHLNYTNNEISK